MPWEDGTGGGGGDRRDQRVGRLRRMVAGAAPLCFFTISVGGGRQQDDGWEQEGCWWGQGVCTGCATGPLT